METQVSLMSLESLLPGKLSYSSSANAFISNGYTSAANNTYFNAIRFAEGIVIKEDIGQGYAHTFLNGLRIYSLESRTLLTDRSFHCQFYSKETVIRQAKEMLVNLLHEAARHQGKTLNMSDVSSIIDKLLRDAFEQDQVELAQRQTRYLLGR